MVLQKAVTSISKDKVIPRILFNGVPSLETTYIRHVFGLDGSITISDEWKEELGYELKINPMDFGFAGTVELYEDADTQIVMVSYKFKWGGKNYEIQVYFYFGVDYGNRVKVKIKGKLPHAGNLRIPFQAVKGKFDAGSRQFWSGLIQKGIVLSGVGLDWSDTFVSWSFNEVTKTLQFSIAPTFEIDPSIIATSTSSAAISVPSQRKCFYAVGRHWVFYSDGTNMVYRTSTDGTTWTTATTVRAAISGATFSIHFDGTYLHYAYSSGAGGDPILYRRGTPNSDGTITWSATEQTALEGINADNPVDFLTPTVSVDSSGYPFIAYRRYDETPATFLVSVTKSSTNIGTWVTATGFPYILSGTVTGVAVIVPMLSLRMLAVYVGSGYTIRAKLWSGSAWGTEEVASTSTSGMDLVSAINEGDDVFIGFQKSTTYGLLIVKRTYGVGWGSEVTVQAGVDVASFPVLSWQETGKFKVFWAGTPSANILYYKTVTGMTPDASPTLLYQEGSGIKYGYDATVNFYGSTWLSQSFKVYNSFNLKAVRVLLTRISASPFPTININVAVYLADTSGRPTGSSLGSTTIPNFEISLTWQIATFTTAISLTAGNSYCIVLSAPTGTSANYYQWHVDSTSPPFTDGNWATSTDSGGTWTADTTKDGMFEVIPDTGQMTGHDRLTSFYKMYEYYIGLVYMTKTASPYDIKYTFISFAPPVVPPKIIGDGLTWIVTY